MNTQLFEMNSIMSSVDSYKVSHWNQFPEGTEELSLYTESRGGTDGDIVSAGMNYVARCLANPVTQEKVDFMNTLFKAHFGREIFNYEGWSKIAALGYNPLTYRAVPEGTPLPAKVPVSIMSAKKEHFWLAGWVETLNVRGTWYPSTVATNSRECKKVINHWLKKTSDLKGVDFDMVLNTRLHDFGARGVSSGESAAIGGLAHLYSFLGTDTVEGLMLAISLFGFEGAAGISIPAREHSTTIPYGSKPEEEDQAYKNSIRIFGKGFYACVYDSTSFKRAVDRIEDYAEDIINAGGTMVVRPDSGDMIDNIMYALNKLGEIFGYTINSKGYKVLHPSIRIIQGDEIHGPETINRVLNWMETNKWSAENIAFGMGGGLLQGVGRDDFKYAMKLSAIKINGEWRRVAKCPEGAEWKASKKGLLMTITDGKKFKCIDTLTEEIPDGWRDAMITYYDHGYLNKDDTLGIIRERASI